MVRLALFFVIAVPSVASAEGIFQIGAGYGDDGFVATAKISQDNLFKTGQQLSMWSSISQHRSISEVDYNVPLGDGIQLESTLFYERRDLPPFMRDGVGGSIGLGAKIDPHTRVYIRYKLEQISTDTGEMATELARATGAMPPMRASGDGIVATLGGGIVHDTTDNPIPLHGERIEFSAEAADPRLGSDYALWRVATRMSGAKPLGPLTLRSSTRATFVGSSEPGGVPRSERIYATSRGSLASLEQGANVELAGRLELEAPVWSRVGLSVAAFYDGAFALDTDPAFGAIRAALHHAAGASIIWRSPIGPLRFDWSIPLDGPDHEPRFLFWLGSQF